MTSFSNVRQNVSNQFRKFGEDVQDNPLITIISWLMLVGLIVALCKIISINVAPYFDLMTAGNEGNWVKHIPILGHAIKAWEGAIAAIGGLLIWGLTQSMQILWIIVGLDRKAHASALKQSQEFNFGAYTTTGSASQSHDPYVRRMAKKARRIPFFFVRWALFLGLVAYAFDLVVGIRLYPPAESVSTFTRAVTIGTLRGISLDNLTNLFIMLFSFEALAIPTIVVGQWVWTRNRD